MCTWFLRHTQASNLREFIECFASDPMSTSAESLEEVHLRDMSGEGKREQQALMRAPQEEVPPTGCGATACAGVLVVVSILFMVMTFPFSLLYVIKVVNQYERAVVFRLGRIKGGREQPPGILFLLPCLDQLEKVDTRLKTFDVPPQKILTKDSVTVHVDAIVNFRITNPVMSIKNVRNADYATRQLAQTTLRNILGSHKLSELLELRDTIQHQLQTQLDEATDPWGVKVETVAIKDVRIPRELQRAMAAEAEATREAKAKVINADGELNAARALKEAAETIASSRTAMQLRYLQTLNIIAAERGSTIMFPIPIDILGGMQGGLGAGFGATGPGMFPPIQKVEAAEETIRSDI